MDRDRAWTAGLAGIGTVAVSVGAQTMMSSAPLSVARWGSIVWVAAVVVGAAAATFAARKVFRGGRASSPVATAGGAFLGCFVGYMLTAWIWGPGWGLDALTMTGAVLQLAVCAAVGAYFFGLAPRKRTEEAVNP
jgi:hypothetical protein